MQANVRKDWTWADGYLPEIRRILADNALSLVNIQIASEEQDLKKATDMVLTISGRGAIAVRVRRPKWHYRDLTLRAWRRSGVRTELEKISAGSGDFYLYCWASVTGMTIPEWMLVDLHMLRASGLLQQAAMTRNTDGETGFAHIAFKDMARAGCIVNSYIKSYHAPVSVKPAQSVLLEKQLKLF